MMDANAQPTIRPVLDLSDVEAGASKMNDLFNANPLVGAVSKANSIGSSMSNGQNGDFDIISAIKDLTNKISEGMGNSYVVNGITYDDGSAVADAVSGLVRAARIERRI